MMIKRYGWSDNGRFELCGNSVFGELDTGDYVKHSDHIKEVERLKDGVSKVADRIEQVIDCLNTTLLNDHLIELRAIASEPPEDV